MDEVKELRDQLEELLEQKLEKLSKLDEGTEEHSRLTEDISKLYKQWVEQYRIEQDLVCKWEQLQNEKLRDEVDAEMKRRQFSFDLKKHRRISWNTILTCSVVVGLTIGCCVFEANGHIFPMKLLRYADKIKFFV